MGKQKSVKKRKLPDIKSLIFGSSYKDTTIPGSRFPNGTQGLVPVVDIQSGVVITEDGRYLKILEVLPTNFYLKSSMEQQNIIYYMASYLRIAPVSLQILVQTGRADIDAYCEQMQKCYDTEKNEMCRDMILEDAQLVNYLAANEAVTRKFYLIFQHEGTATEFSEIAKQLSEAAETAYQYLDYCGLEVLRHEQYDEFLFRTLYTAIRRKTTYEVDHKALFAEIGTIHGSEEIPEELSEEDQLGIITVQDVLSPTESDLTNKEYIVIDGMYYAYLYVSGYGYPTQASLAWLSPLVELGDGISISYYLNKKRKEQVDARNQLDGLIFTVEKTLKDNADKISEDDKAKLEASVATAKTELESGDFDRIKAATESLSNDAQGIFAKLYQNGGNNGSGNPGEGGGAGDTEFHQG
jgi:hypothetical protein